MLRKKISIKNLLFVNKFGRYLRIFSSFKILIYVYFTFILFSMFKTPRSRTVIIISASEIPEIADLPWNEILPPENHEFYNSFEIPLAANQFDGGIVIFHPIDLLPAMPHLPQIGLVFLPTLVNNSSRIMLFKII